MRTILWKRWDNKLLRSIIFRHSKTSLGVPIEGSTYYFHFYVRGKKNSKNCTIFICIFFIIIKTNATENVYIFYFIFGICIIPATQLSKPHKPKKLTFVHITIRAYQNWYLILGFTLTFKNILEHFCIYII